MSVRHFSAVAEWASDDKVWVTHVPALDGLSLYGDTRGAALESTREAIAGYLEATGSPCGRAVHGNRDLPIGTLRAILRQAELTADELASLL
ncbi:MAG: hypothetical protein ACRDUV_09760 [Pseudonocardiaceae bacterium]